MSLPLLIYDSLPLEKELEFRQLNDLIIESIASELEENDHKKFELLNGLIFRKGLDKPRFYVAESMINDNKCDSCLSR